MPKTVSERQRANVSAAGTARGSIARSMRGAQLRIGAYVAAVILAAIALYRWLLSPIFGALGARCRFHPSCSTYATEAVRHYGPVRGSWRALKRLGRCHPFHPGGYDPPIPSDSING